MTGLLRAPVQTVRRFQSEVGELRELQVPRRARWTLRLAAAMFTALIIVAACFDIDRVVTSVSGQIVTVDPTVVVQPLDASIIKTIDVHEGDRVKSGQLLATLDPTLVAADATTLRLQINNLDAEIARCEAELAHRPFSFATGHEPGGPQYAALQLAYFVQRKAQFDAQIRADDAQAALARATIVRLETDGAAYAERMGLAAEVEQMRQQMYAKQFESRLTLLEATDARAEMRRNMQFDANSRIEADRTLEAAIATREAFVQQWDAQTSQELLTARAARDAAVQQLDKAALHQNLVKLFAPDDAIVLRLARLSVGSVLQPGDELLELAKLTSATEVEIYIDPRDIGFIRPGDPATIKFDPYHFVEHGWARGHVSWISDGTFSVPPTGTGGTMGAATTSPGGLPTATLTQSALTAPFYKARVTIDALEMKNLPEGFRLMPGTTLTVDIHVGTRSLLTYLTRGIVRTFDESMREP